HSAASAGSLLNIRARESHMKIYVGNLATDTSVAQLRTMFEAHGEVKRARLAKDKETGSPRGFGYVEMEDEEARVAINALHATKAGGQPQPLKVRQARK